jgi:hypothetical protein
MRGNILSGTESIFGRLITMKERLSNIAEDPKAQNSTATHFYSKDIIKILIT